VANTRNLLTGVHLGCLLVGLYSLSMLPPLLVSLFYHEDVVWPFFGTFVVVGLSGLTGSLVTFQHRSTLKHRDGFLVLVVFWLLMSLVSAVPFYWSSELGLSLVDALFEGVSGITTTGASILTDIDHTPRSFLYYRAQLNFLGGLGIIILAVALLPVIGIGGGRLYQTEAPGPSKNERLMPRMADTARRIWLIYALLGFVCAVAYRMAGMEWFHAICHSLSTVSLGGFSTHSASLGYYQSAAVESVAALFFLIAAINFSLYFSVWHRKSLRPLLQDQEARFFMAVTLLVAAFTCIYLIHMEVFPASQALHHGFFQAISVVTGNGLGTVGYPDWPAPISILLILFSYFGGCVGSTCGGIKVMRFLIMFRQAQQYLFQSIHPNAVAIVKYGSHRVDNSVIQAIWAFFFIYVMMACAFVMALVLTGEDLITAFGTTAACLNNMGIGYGSTAAGFAPLTGTGKLLMCLAMLLGRLEIFPLVIVFSRQYWRF
jgi:trk system potassium uptake protein TrkH